MMWFSVFTYNDNHEGGFITQHTDIKNLIGKQLKFKNPNWKATNQKREKGGFYEGQTAPIVC